MKSHIENNYVDHMVFPDIPWHKLMLDFEELMDAPRNDCVEFLIWRVLYDGKFVLSSRKFVDDIKKSIFSLLAYALRNNTGDHHNCSACVLFSVGDNGPELRPCHHEIGYWVGKNFSLT